MRIEAVYLDLTDLRSARVWEWLTALRRVRDVEVRPFCIEVDDPWECGAPPLSLELLMLLEAARHRSVDAVVRLVDTAFDRISLDRSAHGELATWLEVGTAAGLDPSLDAEQREQLQAEVGYWQAEARELGVRSAPALVTDGGVVVHLQLDADVDDAEEAATLLEAVRQRVERSGSGGADL